MFVSFILCVVICVCIDINLNIYRVVSRLVLSQTTIQNRTLHRGSRFRSKLVYCVRHGCINCVLRNRVLLPYSHFNLEVSDVTLECRTQDVEDDLVNLVSFVFYRIWCWVCVIGVVLGNAFWYLIHTSTWKLRDDAGMQNTGRCRRSGWYFGI